MKQAEAKKDFRAGDENGYDDEDDDDPGDICEKKESAQITTNYRRWMSLRKDHALVIFLSATASLRISARSRNTRHRSFSTCVRDLISRYSLTAE